MCGCIKFPDNRTSFHASPFFCLSPTFLLNSYTIAAGKAAHKKGLFIGLFLPSLKVTTTLSYFYQEHETRPCNLNGSTFFRTIFCILRKVAKLSLTEILKLHCRVTIKVLKNRLAQIHILLRVEYNFLLHIPPCMKMKLNVIQNRLYVLAFSKKLLLVKYSLCENFPSCAIVPKCSYTNDITSYTLQKVPFFKLS